MWKFTRIITRNINLEKGSSYIKQEKVKTPNFLSGFPSFYKEKIQFGEPMTLEETIQKAKQMHD